MTEREQFEAWAKQPPMEWDCERYTENEAWPDSYRNYPTQCAWEGWQAARAGLVSPVAVTAQTAQAVPLLTDEEIDAAYEKARADYQRSRFAVRGQQLTAQDSPDWWFARAIEAAVRAKCGIVGKEGA